MIIVCFEDDYYENWFFFSMGKDGEDTMGQLWEHDESWKGISFIYN